MKSNMRVQRGFTLIEILVAILIFVVIMTAALLIYDRSNKIFKSSVESAQMQQSTRVGFDRLVSDVRMAGFDFDRDGIPDNGVAKVWVASAAYNFGDTVIPNPPNGFAYRCTVAGISNSTPPSWSTVPGQSFTDGSVTWVTRGNAEFQQPDEQIEYAGASAVTIRGNLNYDAPASDAAHDAGREPDYEPALKEFPIVTTSNREIVTYALVSADSTKNTGQIQFYADTRRPRAAYPGGQAEQQVTITGVDLTNANPPYTLYRYTLDETGAPVGQPLAENIRSLTFDYYIDASGATLLKKADGTVLAHGAIGGDGQYNPDNIGATANYADRGQRALINSVKVSLVGMNEAPDYAYTNPTETIAAVKNFREYTLSSLVVPRNIGMSGMAESAMTPPGQPTVTAVCVGHCRATVVYWNPPASGANVYEVHWDTSPTGGFTTFCCTSSNLSAAVLGLNSGTTYYFKVYARNSQGVTPSSNYVAGTPINKTKPAAPTDLQGSDGTMADAISLTWPAVTLNDPSANQLTCNPAGSGNSDATNIPPYEPIYYRIWRSTNQNFDPTAGEGVIVLDNTNTQPTASGANMTWVDSATTSKNNVGPANCVDYYYRIQAFDYCSLNPADNDPAVSATGQSTIFPAVGSPARHGKAVSNQVPSSPGQPTINAAASSCNATTNLCTVALGWPPVTTDVNGTRITIDSYSILRQDGPTATGPWGSANVVGTTSGGATTYTDTTGADHDPSTGLRIYHRYTIEATQCSKESNPSPGVVYPSPCSSTFALQPTEAQLSTPTNPYIVNATSSVGVVPVSGTIQSVTFTLYDSNGSVVIPPFTQTSGFVFLWSEQDPAIPFYTLKADVTDTAGCTSTLYAYLQQETPPACAYAPASAPGTLTSSTSGNTKTTTVPFTVSSTGTRNVTIRKINITWARPSQYADATLNLTVNFNGTNVNLPNGTPTAPPGTGLVNVTGAPTINAGANYTIAAKFAYKKSDNSGAQIPNPITKVCVAYTDPAFPNDTFFCNVFGNGNNNPTSCN